MAESIFEIKAEAIATTQPTHGISQIVIFNPTEDTRSRILSLVDGDAMGRLRLVDQFDNGNEDVHIGNRESWFVGRVSSGDARKTKTIILIVKDLFRFD